MNYHIVDQSADKNNKGGSCHGDIQNSQKFIIKLMTLQKTVTKHYVDNWLQFYNFSQFNQPHPSPKKH